METHLKIGEFARLAHVSLKTLHHYDAVGLLPPAHVDRFTGYRYYTLEQLPRLKPSLRCATWASHWSRWLNQAVCRYMQAAGLAGDGVSLALYYDGGAQDDGIDVEMAYVVAPPALLPPTADAGVHSLPAAHVAYAVYHGSYDDFAAVGQLHAALRRWIEEQGWEFGSPVR